MHVLDAIKTCKGVQRLKIGRKQFAGLFDETGAEGASTLSWDVHRYNISRGGEIYATGKAEREYFPLADDDLFLSFARLGASRGDPSPNRVLGWVQEHGLLTLRDGPRREQAPISLEDFRAEVRRAREMLDLYAELKAQDAQAVAARLFESRPPFDVARGRNWRSNSQFGPVRFMLRNAKEMSREDVDLSAGFDSLAVALTDRLKGVSIRLSASFPDIARSADGGFKVPESAYSLTQGWSCPDLLSGLYLQFYLMIFKDRLMRRCKNRACGLPFPLTRKDKWHCNDSCRSNARNYR